MFCQPALMPIASQTLLQDQEPSPLSNPSYESHLQVTKPPLEVELTQPIYLTDTVNWPDGTVQNHLLWADIHVFAEVTRSYPLPKQTLSTINNKIYLLFISQPNLHYDPAIYFNGASQNFPYSH